MAIVTKMQKSFGAPVADSSVKEIVQYLVSIKGKGWRVSCFAHWLCHEELQRSVVRL